MANLFFKRVSMANAQAVYFFYLFPPTFSPITQLKKIDNFALRPLIHILVLHITFLCTHPIMLFSLLFCCLKLFLVTYLIIHSDIVEFIFNLVLNLYIIGSNGMGCLELLFINICKGLLVWNNGSATQVLKQINSKSLQCISMLTFSFQYIILLL